MASTPPSRGSEQGGPIIFREDSIRLKPASPAQVPSATVTVQSTVLHTDTFQPTELKPQPSDILEINGLLKVKTSQLALGACERVRRLSKAFPMDICNSPILPQLAVILEDGPGTPLAAAALSALAALALDPEGRQRIVMAGAAVPIIKLISRADPSRPNTCKAVQVLMNLAADSLNRKILRDLGAVEAVVNLMKVAPLDTAMEQAMGALHNVMLTDSKAKLRAVEAGIAYGLARTLSQHMPDSAILAVRCRMLLADLLRVQDLQDRIIAAAQELCLRIPGMPATHRFSSTTANGSKQGSLRNSRQGSLQHSGNASPHAATVGVDSLRSGSASKPAISTQEAAAETISTA